MICSMKSANSDCVFTSRFVCYPEKSYADHNASVITCATTGFLCSGIHGMLKSSIAFQTKSRSEPHDATPMQEVACRFVYRMSRRVHRDMADNASTGVILLAKKFGVYHQRTALSILHGFTPTWSTHSLSGLCSENWYDPFPAGRIRLHSFRGRAQRPGSRLVTQRAGPRFKVSKHV
jgi:hypothetical protein